MLDVFVWDEDFMNDADGPYTFEVPLDTPWSDIHVVVRLIYPTANKVLIEVREAA
jgi:hypothetical protein